jgi:hypothetical protein
MFRFLAKTPSAFAWTTPFWLKIELGVARRVLFNKSMGFFEFLTLAREKGDLWTNLAFLETPIWQPTST